jgi:DNA-binding CsgD family transcriptional regulator/tetratricopeptide (TPR) repeat protein
VAALAAGLARTAATVVPGAGRRMLERLGIAGAPPPTAGTLANMLGADLAAWPGDAWLAIDDYHFAMDSPASETFVEELMARCPVRLLITSRGRPTWATPRRMLYGEILEVGRSVLALTHDEARQVLPERKVEEVAGVLALTEGWPAVIGLASLSSDLVLSEAEVPDELYGYCAGELLQRFAPGLRRALCTLALAPSITPDLARALYGEEAVRILDAAEDGGFLTRGPGGVYDMHPLLRTVLLRKLEEEGGERVKRTMSELAAFLIKARRWDEAFAVAERAADKRLQEEVVDAALDELLTENRLETLKHWIARARTEAPSPILDLAEAEVAFRGGDASAALLHATNAASQFPEGHLRLSRSWFRASQSAYFLDRVAEARELCEKARASAISPRDTKDALWGLFNAGVDLADRTATSFLTEIESLRPLNPSDEIRVAGGRVFLASRLGGLEPALRPARALMERVSAADPVIKSGFLNNYSQGLLLTARYEEALTAVDVELSLAREFSLDFVVPHGQLVRGQACLGLRRFADSEQAFRKAVSANEPFITVAAATFGARLPLYRGQPGEALAMLGGIGDCDSIPSICAELVGTTALALAALRRVNDATAACEEALHLAQNIETCVLVASAQAIIALVQGSGDSAVLAERAFRLALEYGNLDTFVCAYRTWPELLGTIAKASELESSLSSLLVRANDLPLARRAGLRTSSVPSRWQLTRREQEILRLVAKGLTNREIAEQLVVAESTVKVHVRHVLRKLGVRSRTEAAIRAAMSEAD